MHAVVDRTGHADLGAQLVDATARGGYDDCDFDGASDDDAELASTCAAAAHTALGKPTEGVKQRIHDSVAAHVRQHVPPGRRAVVTIADDVTEVTIGAAGDDDAGDRTERASASNHDRPGNRN